MSGPRYKLDLSSRTVPELTDKKIHTVTVTVHGATGNEKVACSNSDADVKVTIKTKLISDVDYVEGMLEPSGSGNFHIRFSLQSTEGLTPSALHFFIVNPPADSTGHEIFMGRRMPAPPAPAPATTPATEPLVVTPPATGATLVPTGTSDAIDNSKVAFLSVESKSILPTNASDLDQVHDGDEDADDPDSDIMHVEHKNGPDDPTEEARKIQRTPTVLDDDRPADVGVDASDLDAVSDPLSTDPNATPAPIPPPPPPSSDDDDEDEGPVPSDTTGIIARNAKKIANLTGKGATPFTDPQPTPLKDADGELLGLPGMTPAPVQARRASGAATQKPPVVPKLAPSPPPPPPPPPPKPEPEAPWEMPSETPVPTPAVVPKTSVVARKTPSSLADVQQQNPLWNMPKDPGEPDPDAEDAAERSATAKMLEDRRTGKTLVPVDAKTRGSALQPIQSHNTEPPEHDWFDTEEPPRKSGIVVSVIAIGIMMGLVMAVSVVSLGGAYVLQNEDLLVMRDDGPKPIPGTEPVTRPPDPVSPPMPTVPPTPVVEPPPIVEAPAADTDDTVADPTAGAEVAPEDSDVPHWPRMLLPTGDGGSLESWNLEEACASGNAVYYGKGSECPAGTAVAPKATVAVDERPLPDPPKVEEVPPVVETPKVETPPVVEPPPTPVEPPKVEEPPAVAMTEPDPPKVEEPKVVEEPKEEPVTCGWYYDSAFGPQAVLLDGKYLLECSDGKVYQAGTSSCARGACTHDNLTEVNRDDLKR